jgi:hypothetical protein
MRIFIRINLLKRKHFPFIKIKLIEYNTKLTRSIIKRENKVTFSNVGDPTGKVI